MSKLKLYEMNIILNRWTVLVLLIIAGGCNSFRVSPSKKIENLNFDTSTKSQDYPILYQNPENSPELNNLNSKYGLSEITEQHEKELDKVLALLAWTNSRWSHSGSNTPSEPNTLIILEEAETGQKFRCVEYGIVLKSVLAAQGFPARTLGLKTKDVEITLLGAGHVLSEVWLKDYQKWAILDAQFNIMPVLNGIPLNAVEFQKAIVGNEEFQLINSSGVVSDKERKKYLRFIPHYLYYFDFRFDQRENTWEEAVKLEDKGYLMLMPIDAKLPKVFQRKSEMDYFIYSNSLKEFYAPPN